MCQIIVRAWWGNRAVDDDGERMVACDNCGIWMHSRCIGIEDDFEIAHDFCLTQKMTCPVCHVGVR